MPATGKSTIARELEKHYGFPVFEKDAIKECLFDTIGFESYAEKRQLDVAANTVLLMQMDRMLSVGCSLIVNNNFDEESAVKLKSLLQKYNIDCVTIFLTGDPQILYERYFERDNLGKRHLGHAMQTHYPPHAGESLKFVMTRSGFDERFINRKMNEMTWGGKHLDINVTDSSVLDVNKLIDQIDNWSSVKI